MEAIHLCRRFTMSLRAVPGGLLFSDSVRRLFGKSTRIERVHDFDGNLTIDLDLGEHMQSQIFWHGSYSADIISLLHRLVKPGMVVMDAGANIGEITLVAAKLVGREGRVFSFEPIRRFAACLEENVRANSDSLADVYVVQKALSSKSGEANIFVADSEFVDGTQNNGLGTLFASATRSQVEGVVSLITLDDFVSYQEGLDRVDLIKLDIEGGELAAIQGAAAVLERYSPALIVEVGDETCRAAGYQMDDITNELSSRGYKMYVIGRKGRLTPFSEDNIRSFQNIYCIKPGRHLA